MNLTLRSARLGVRQKVSERDAAIQVRARSSRSRLSIMARHPAGGAAAFQVNAA
jgi:hypothetical protein